MSNVSDPAIALAAPEYSGQSTALVQRLLNFVLFITMLTSSIAFIEPSPHDALMFLLLVMCVVARVTFDRKLLPLLLILMVWLTGGFMALIQVGDNAKAIQYVGTSVYLAIATMMFACLFSKGNLVRLLIVRRAYIIAALIATAAGYIGFFHLLPGADVFLDISTESATFNARVSATFKDPNVYGPFLVFPLLLLMIDAMTRGVRLLDLAVMAALLGGLFLSFSRGAWIHFGMSAIIVVAILYISTPNPRMRARIVAFVVLAAIAIALFLITLMSIGSVHDMFVERAKALQPYDTGPGGRFTLQQFALAEVLDHPNGLGPFEFARLFGIQQHNQYLQGLLVYGWLGGITYLTIVILTLAIGLRNALVPTPWQGYLVAAYATFVGVAFEGMIVDTDHWRHFFLMLGMIWGLTVANLNSARQARNVDAGGSATMIPVMT